jgi:hypothetical protein
MRGVVYETFQLQGAIGRKLLLPGQYVMNLKERSSYRRYDQENDRPKDQVTND